MSLSNDLLSYSIMKNPGSKPISNSQILLPPLLPIIRQWKDPVILPPINYTSSSTYNTYSQKNDSSQSQPRPGLGDLTEYNLSHWNNQVTHFNHGLGLLSAIAHMNSSLNVENSSVSSVSSITPSSPGYSEPISVAAKRRQRLGPSCDSCRSRKVKCNAEITVLSKDITSKDFEIFNLEQVSKLNNSETVIHDGLFYVVSNGKLIRFRSCKSCKMKRLDCCFSSGFTKEDIIGKKVRKTKPSVPTLNVLPITPPTVPSSPERKQKKTQVTELENSRKSSCVLCRKRKVKCVYNDEIQKCEGCNKKNTECFFGKSK